MTKLQCSVNSCSSFSNGYCCRPSIHVNGPTASASSQTCCQSFTDNKNQMTSGVQYNTPNQSLNISCDAHNCTYNQNNQCSASSVCISSNFSGTECTSFKQS